MPIVKLFASLRQIAGTKEAHVTAATAGEVVNQLAKDIPALAASLLEKDPDAAGLRPVREHVILTINGQLSDDMKTPVTENDQIAIFPPIAGGSGN